MTNAEIQSTQYLSQPLLLRRRESTVRLCPTGIFTRFCLNCRSASRLSASDARLVLSLA
jgi:hypothetical protein